MCSRPDDLTGYGTPSESSLDVSERGFTVTVTCALGYQGTATVTPCTSSGPYAVSGCTAVVCTAPPLPAGYTTPVERVLDLSLGDFDVSSTCAAGYEGTATATCIASGHYTLTGCSPIVCSTPAELTGYSVQAQANLHLNLGEFDVSVLCEPGYEGTGVATSCSASGPYAVSGCAPIVCTTPLDLDGYTTPVEHNLDLFRGVLDVETTCEAGYEGTAVAACATSGPYQLSGCHPIVCVAAEDALGYASIVDDELDLSTGEFLATASCAAGYHGTAVAAACGEGGGEYLLSGCSPIACTPPADVTGYVVTETELRPTLG
eukprot:COSAG06_NODE_15787_length_1044_cov_4.522751_2_plen_317_part_01